jgi:stearoyl-CoA desaturase (delta-9 desaturase)
MNSKTDPKPPDKKFWLQWLDGDQATIDPQSPEAQRIDWLRCLPYILVHFMCLGVFWVGFSWIALGIALALYFIRMFFITGFYHRYFSHRAFRTSRTFQLVMAILGSSAAQRGPLWWASHHRHHHAFADRPEDAHSPRLRGMLYSHTGWLMTPANFPTRTRYVPDWSKFPELRFLNRFDWLVPLLLAATLYFTGSLLARYYPEWGTGGMQLLIWGFFVSTVALYHGTFSINSLAHRFGKRRYETPDDSRNNFWLALLTLGEGWHNNHHQYPGSSRQGFYWWELDMTYYLLLALRRLGLVWDLRPIPQAAFAKDPNRTGREAR